MTTEQWERENQDTLMEYFIDGDPSVRRIQCEYCRTLGSPSMKYSIRVS